ncbi:MAG: hypothetical protein Kow0058_14140 [Roseovarius sp.]
MALRGDWPAASAMPGRLTILLAGFLALKAGLIAQLGPHAYGGAVHRMGHGGMAERLGAVVMHADPLSMTLARGLSLHVR